jgi:hypothetical protein
MTKAPKKTGRPRREDRASVAEVTLPFRMTKLERATLDRLVTLRGEELAGEGVSVTASSFLRWLVLREAKARGLDMASLAAPSPAPAPPAARKRTARPAARRSRAKKP